MSTYIYIFKRHDTTFDLIRLIRTVLKLRWRCVRNVASLRDYVCKGMHKRRRNSRDVNGDEESDRRSASPWRRCVSA